MIDIAVRDVCSAIPLIAALLSYFNDKLRLDLAPAEF